MKLDLLEYQSIAVADRKTDFCAPCVLLICAVTALLQTYPSCRHTPLAIDEQVSYFLADGIDFHDVWHRTTTQAATPPLTFALLHLPCALMQAWPEFKNELTFRFLCPLAMATATLAVWFATKPIAGRGGAAAAAILLSFHADVLYQATQARPYIFGLAFNLGAIACIVRLRQVGWSRRFALGLLLLDVALLWTHFLFATFLAGQTLLAIFVHPVGTKGRESTGFPAAIAAVVGIQILAVFSMTPLAPMLFRLQANGPLLNWITEHRSWTQQFDQIPIWPTAITLGAAIVVGIVRWSRRSRFRSTDFVIVRKVSTSIGLLLAYLAPIFLLWLSSGFLGAAIAQPRYYFVQVGVLSIGIAWLLAMLAGQKSAIGLAVLCVALGGAPRRFFDYLTNPVRHDYSWKNAAAKINGRNKPGDLVLVQTGLVESLMVPTQFHDPDFQGYVGSRLSDFYLNEQVKKLSLPLRWLTGEWQAEYAKEIDKAQRAGGQIFLVISADSDLGKAVANEASRWLAGQGYRLEDVQNDPVAMVWQAVPIGQ